MKIMIQARTNSTRLPNKIMGLIAGKPMLQHVIENCKQISKNVIVLIPENDPVKKWLIENKTEYFEGSETNVLERYYEAAVKFEAKTIMRITSDCPFVEPAYMNYMTALTEALNLDFITNQPCVDGQDIEIMSFKALKWCHFTAKDDCDREHVTTYIKDHLKEFIKMEARFAKVQSPYNDKWFPKMSVDTQTELDWANEHMKYLNKKAVQDGK